MKQEKRQRRVKHNESLSYTVEVKNKEGQVLRRISAPSRSYVEQWNVLTCIQVGGVNRMITISNGSPYSAAPHSANFRANPGAGDTGQGIRVGKGTTPVAIDDYALETPCEEGTGTDEFNHQTYTKTAPSVVGSTCSFTHQRVMINNSGAAISVNEIGCHLGATGFGYLGFRDVLPSTVSVPDGGSITVTYTMKVTV
ncbi:hypothetical protein ES703_64444 [subsurface metagenome]